MSKRGALKKGYLKNRITHEILNFKFNPSTVQRSRGVNYKNIAGGGSPHPFYEYTGGGEETLTFSLHIFEDKTSYSEYTKFFEGVMPPRDTRAKWEVPPTVYISFGKIVERAILTNYSETHEHFDTELNTIQAVFDLTFKVVR